MELSSLTIQAVTPKGPEPWGPSLTLHQPVVEPVGASCSLSPRGARGKQKPPVPSTVAQITQPPLWTTGPRSCLRQILGVRVLQGPRQRAVNTGEQCHLRSTLELSARTHGTAIAEQETRRSTTLLLGSVLLARKAHALALDNGRRFRPLVLPVHQEPGEDDRGHCNGQQADARAITNPVGRPKFRLVDLWPLTQYTVSYAGVSAPNRWCAGVVTLTTMPMSCVTPYKATVESVIVSSFRRGLPCPCTHIGDTNRQSCTRSPTRRSDAFCPSGHGVS